MEQFMPGKQAKILSEDDLYDLLAYTSATRNPIRNRVIVLLSAKAGLRAGERVGAALPMGPARSCCPSVVAPWPR